MKVRIDQVVVEEPRRALRDVTDLMQSIREIGLLNPITLTKDFRLVAGLHRLEACKRLGWTEIEAVFIEADELKARLAQIDENLVRQELTDLERAEALAERKRLYEALHPQARTGPGRPPKNNETVSPFSVDTAAKLGVSPRTIQQDVQIAGRLTPAVRDLIRNTPLADKKRELLELARLCPDEQEAVARTVTGGEFARVEDAIAALRGQKQQAEANTTKTTELPKADAPGAWEAVESAAPLGGADGEEEPDAGDTSPGTTAPEPQQVPFAEELEPAGIGAPVLAESPEPSEPTSEAVANDNPRDTEPRDPTGPPYPFLACPGWKPYHVMEALEHLNRLPADERSEVSSLLEQPAIPPANAIEIIKNLAGMTPDERQAIYRWNRSDDPRERSLALTQAARKPPMPDPRLNYLEDARKLIGKAAALSSGQLRQELEDMRDWLTEAIRLVEEEDRRAAAAVGWPRPAA